MAESIDDWYANASARRAGDLGRDWENDDQPDRGPDSWLDERDSGRFDRAASAPPKSATSSRTSTTRGPAAGRVPVTLVDHARAIQAAFPGIGFKKLTRRLRQSGWPHASESDVRRALGDQAGSAPSVRNTLETPAQRSMPQPSGAAATSTGEASRRDGTPIDESERLTLAVLVIRKAEPGITNDRLRQRLRRCGWPTISEAGVRAAIEVMKAEQAVLKHAATTPAGGPAAHSKGDLDPESLIVAVRVLRDVFPRLSSGELARRLREFGWHLVARDQVRTAMTTLDPESARAWSPPALRTKPVGATANAAAANMLDRSASTTRTQPPKSPRKTRSTISRNRGSKPSPDPRLETCPSCGVAISVLGTCRCS